MFRKFAFFGICLLLSACAAPTIDTPSPTPKIILTSEILYTSEMQLDIYAPAQPGSYPVVIAFHGSGVTKLSFKNLGNALAAEGVVVFAADWHASPPTTEDSYLTGWEEAACAVRFARQHAAEYQGDPNRIIVVGHSAGGAVGAAITLAGDTFNGDCLAEPGSALPDGFIGLDGAYSILNFIPDSLKEILPDERLHQIDPYTALAQQPQRESLPFILFVGDEIPELVQFSEEFYTTLLDEGYPAELTQLPETSHSAIVTFPNPEVIKAIIELAYGN